MCDRVERYEGDMNIRLVTQSLGAASAQAQHPPVNGSDQELVLMDFSCPAPPSPAPGLWSAATLTVLTAWTLVWAWSLLQRHNFSANLFITHS